MPGVPFLQTCRIAVLIDGGHLRVRARRDQRPHTVDLVTNIAHGCLETGESLFRVLYYDCAPYSGTVRRPVSGEPHVFEGSDGWLRELASKPLIAVRRGVLKFRGWTPKSIPLRSGTLRDEDFIPAFEQKGVDMRIGLDIAGFTPLRILDRIVLVTADTDCVPALKQARIGRLQTVLGVLPGCRPPPELTWHSDYVRQLEWPMT